MSRLKVQGVIILVLAASNIWWSWVANRREGQLRQSMELTEQALDALKTCHDTPTEPMEKLHLAGSSLPGRSNRTTTGRDVENLWISPLVRQ